MYGSVIICYFSSFHMLSIRGQCGEELVADVFNHTEETFSTEGHTEVLQSQEFSFSSSYVFSLV